MKTKSNQVAPALTIRDLTSTIGYKLSFLSGKITFHKKTGTIFATKEHQQLIEDYVTVEVDDGKCIVNAGGKQKASIINTLNKAVK